MFNTPITHYSLCQLLVLGDGSPGLGVDRASGQLELPNVTLWMEAEQQVSLSLSLADDEELGVFPDCRHVACE